MVGIDRLLSAVAANRLRPPDHEMVVVDLGTAVTVDLLSAGGAFQGGAICPGIGTSARALHEFTDLLPQLDMTELHTPPPACGRDTQGAMRSGLFWGAVGGVRELVARLSTPGKPHTVVMTGGAAPNVAALVAPDALFVPHLTLSGIALAAAQPA
jgi:type III pantothenate kinase